MRQFRQIVFWCHLLAGAFAGSVVLVMSATGVLLTFERQITAWADTRAYHVTPPLAGGARLPVMRLLAAARATREGTPTTLTVRADPTAPVEVGYGREGTVFVDPYTGDAPGEGSATARRFFRVVTDWHRWLGTSDEHRSLGRAITGACNLAFLFLVVSGVYLWMPRRWTRARVRGVAWFRRGLSGKARDFNWHNTIGLWSALPLLIVVASATVISYPWATNLVYRAVGERPPPRPAPPAPAGASDLATPAGRLDPLLARAERQLPGWRTIQLQLPALAEGPATFTIDAGSGRQPQKRAQLALDQRSGEVLRWEPFASQTRGRQIRAVLRFAHTGEVAGAVGQLVAGLASLGAVVLVYTGLALALRRFRAWRARQGAPVEVEEEAEAA